MLYRSLLAILNVLTRLAIRRHKPVVVAVTGSVGKTSTRQAIVTVLRAQYHGHVRATRANLHTELGVPLAVLGIKPCGHNVAGWMLQLFKGFWIALLGAGYPEVLVLEMAANEPGNITALSKLVPPNIAVVTEIGMVPEHVERYAGPKNLAREQARVVEALPVDGWAILNGEDETVLAMRERTDAHTRAYGFVDATSMPLDVSATAFEVRTRNENGQDVPDGVSFKIEFKGTVVPVRIHGTFGRGIVRAALAAAAVGLALGMHLVEISEALSDFAGPSGRLRLLRGLRQSFLIDDSANASPPSVAMALETLRELPAKRRIAVLGDMAGLGKYTEAAHQRVGHDVALVADVVITVGEQMRFAAEEALQHASATLEELHFSTMQEAAVRLREMVAPGDLVLVTGGRAMGLEYIVETLRHV